MDIWKFLATLYQTLEYFRKLYIDQKFKKNRKLFFVVAKIVHNCLKHGKRAFMEKNNSFLF